MGRQGEVQNLGGLSREAAVPVHIPVSAVTTDIQAQQPEGRANLYRHSLRDSEPLLSRYLSSCGRFTGLTAVIERERNFCGG